MGGIQAFQIKSILKTNILNEINLVNNDKIIDYIFFIVKINKTQVEEKTFQKEQFIKHLTLYNIINKKEYNVMLDTINRNDFLNGLDLSFLVIPQLTSCLKVTSVSKDSVANKEEIEEGDLILGSNLNNKCFFLDGIGSLSMLIQRKQCCLLVYKESKKIVKDVNFEKYRVDDRLKLGFIAEAMTFEELWNERRVVVSYEEKDYLKMYEDTVKLGRSLGSKDGNEGSSVELAKEKGFDLSKSVDEDGSCQNKHEENEKKKSVEIDVISPFDENNACLIDENHENISSSSNKLEVNEIYIKNEENEEKSNENNEKSNEKDVKTTKKQIKFKELNALDISTELIASSLIL